VLGVGAAIAIALARYTPEHASLSFPPMRRAVSLLAGLALLVGLAGCGGGDEVSPTPETIVGTLPDVTTSEGPASTVEGDPSNGAQIYASAGCGGCHAMEAAGSSGTVGPNLDESQPDLELVVDRVTNGQGAMPAFGDSLSEQEIADVAAYVVESTS
jgi:mono/diheme cytochrome c family protein